MFRLLGNACVQICYEGVNQGPWVSVSTSGILPSLEVFLLGQDELCVVKPGRTFFLLQGTEKQQEIHVGLANVHS